MPYRSVIGTCKGWPQMGSIRDGIRYTLRGKGGGGANPLGLVVLQFEGPAGTIDAEVEGPAGTVAFVVNGPAP